MRNNYWTKNCKKSVSYLCMINTKIRFLKRKTLKFQPTRQVATLLILIPDYKKKYFCEGEKHYELFSSDAFFWSVIGLKKNGTLSVDPSSEHSKWLRPSRVINLCLSLNRYFLSSQVMPSRARGGPQAKQFYDPLNIEVFFCLIATQNYFIIKYYKDKNIQDIKGNKEPLQPALDLQHTSEQLTL